MDISARQSKLLARIQAALPSLSSNDRLIAEYLIKTFPKGAWETVETVASEVDVSKAAVIRFSARLGYDGFAELQRDLREEVSDLFASPLSLLEAMTPVEGGEVFERYRSTIVRNLTAPPIHGAPEQAMEAARRIAKCRGKIHVVGASKSYGAAYYAHYMLNLILPNVVLVPPQAAVLPNALLDIGARDVVLGICVRRYSTTTLTALGHCRERGAHVIAITDSLLSPAAKLADTLIVAPSESYSLFDSSVMVVFYIEAIASAVASECREAASKRLADAVALQRAFGTFEDSKT